MSLQSVACVRRVAVLADAIDRPIGMRTDPCPGLRLVLPDYLAARHADDSCVLDA